MSSDCEYVHISEHCCNKSITSDTSCLIHLVCQLLYHWARLAWTIHTIDVNNVHSTENCLTCAALLAPEDAAGACQWHPNPNPQKATPPEQALWSLGIPACVRHLCEAGAAALLLCHGHVTDAGTALPAARDAFGAWQQLTHQRAKVRHLLAAQVRAPWDLGIPGSCRPQRLADVAHLLLLFSAVGAAGDCQQRQHLVGVVHLRQKCKQNELTLMIMGSPVQYLASHWIDTKRCSFFFSFLTQAAWEKSCVLWWSYS